MCFHDMILTTFSILLDEEGHIKLTGESFSPSCSQTPVCVCVCVCVCVRYLLLPFVAMLTFNVAGE